MNTIMEKEPFRHEGCSASELKPRRVTSTKILQGLFLLLLPCLYLFHSRFFSIEKVIPSQDYRAKGDVNFEDIVPSERLEWHTCFHDLYCARLTVPMDHLRPLTESKDNPKVHIALVLVPGAGHGHGHFSKSPLLLNPGGPGGSGATFAALAGSRLQQVIGLEQDIIGFDPRGVGATMPRADCFSYPTDGKSPAYEYFDEDSSSGAFNRMLRQAAGGEVGLVNSSSTALVTLHARARSIAKLCQEKDDLHGNNSILRHVDTPAVARDMISIIDAWDEWKDTLDHDLPPSSHEVKLASSITPQELSSLDTKNKLVYWGFSYGTLLGATFAAMFPDRVGRVVLDGVVDADEYVSPLWEDSTRDADAIFDSFSTRCFEAGTACDLYRAGDNSAKDIANRFADILINVKEHPLTFVNKGTKMPILITYDFIRTLIFATLYNPTATFPGLATVADMLSRRDTDQLSMIIFTSPLAQWCHPRAPAYAFPEDAQLAIMCSDKRYKLNETIPELEARFEHMANASSWADVWMTIMIGCEGWSIEAADRHMRWDNDPAHTLKPINTSFPLLFISNTLDPVTPLAAGLSMAKKFVNAGLVEQQSEGHCSLAAPSICTVKTLRAYFNEGKVPPPPMEDSWEKCKADSRPWRCAHEASSPESNEDREIMTAINDVHQVLRNMGFFGMETVFSG